MRYFAQIDDSIVTAVLQAASMPTRVPAGRSFVDITDLPVQGILGWTYDGENFYPPEPPPEGETVTARHFVFLFTPAERLAIRQSNDPDVKDFVAIWFGLDEPITLKAPTTLLALNLLVSEGLLTAARRDQIKTNTPPP
jgi:hypothetical protein